MLNKSVVVKYVDVKTKKDIEKTILDINKMLKCINRKTHPTTFNALSKILIKHEKWLKEVSYNV